MTSMFMVSGEQEIIPDDASIATTEADTPVNGSARRMSYDTNDPSDGRRKQGRVYRLHPAVKQ